MTQPIDGDGTILGKSKLPRPASVSNELQDFAKKWRVEDSNNLRPKGGFVTLAGEQIRFQQYQELLRLATDAHLI